NAAPPVCGGFAGSAPAISTCLSAWPEFPARWWRRTCAIFAKGFPMPAWSRRRAALAAEADGEIDGCGHDHRIEEERHNRVDERDAAHMRRGDGGIRGLGRHADDGRKIKEIPAFGAFCPGKFQPAGGLFACAVSL